MNYVTFTFFLAASNQWDLTKYTYIYIYIYINIYIYILVYMSNNGLKWEFFSQAFTVIYESKKMLFKAS